MNQEMRRSLRGLGNALAKSYFNDWLTEKKRIDKCLEDMVLNSPILKSDRVQGGDHIPPQERLLQLKEENQGYQSLVCNIERMEGFLDDLNDDERAMVDLHYCQGLEFWEISFKLKKERGDVLKNFSSIQKRLGCFWMGESEENVYSENP
jgi:DNA-directed RNA polymerase specialized sigma24 family protein